MQQFEQFIITLTNVNFRSQPVIGDNVILLLPKDAVLRVLAAVEGTTWYQAQLISSGQVGYISSKPVYVASFEPPWLSKAKAIINYLEAYLGTPYVYGSNRNTDTSFDCSDFVRWGYLHQAGIDLPDTSAVQAQAGQTVTLDQVRTCDVLFYDTDADGVINHCSLFVYPNKLLHTYSQTSNVYDRDLVLVQESTGGVTHSLYNGDGEALYKPRPLLIKRYISDDGTSYV